LCLLFPCKFHVISDWLTLNGTFQSCTKGLSTITISLRLRNDKFLFSKVCYNTVEAV
jgi:hypothetical protein